MVSPTRLRYRIASHFSPIVSGALGAAQCSNHIQLQSTTLLSKHSIYVYIHIWVWVNTYRYITIVGWTSIYQLFWCSPGVQGFDTLPYIYIVNHILYTHIWLCHGDPTQFFLPQNIIDAWLRSWTTWTTWRPSYWETGRKFINKLW